MRKLLLYFAAEMRIGEDFPKIEFEVFGFELLEPNAVIGDTLIFMSCLYFYILLKRQANSEYLKIWSRFFALFGITYLLGGFGHMFYNYWEIAGKVPAWILSIVATFFIERAFISIYPNRKWKKLFSRLSNLKLMLALFASILMILMLDLTEDVTRGMMITNLNTLIGLGFAFLYLSPRYSNEIHPSFRKYVYAFFLLAIAGYFQFMKISPAVYFDRNDVGHLIILIVLCLFYQGIRDYSQVSVVKT